MVTKSHLYTRVIELTLKIKCTTVLSTEFLTVLIWPYQAGTLFLPARASEQGNVIGLVSVYIYI